MENKPKAPSKSSLGFFGILKESFKTTSRNKKLLAAILLLVFLSISELDVAENYILAPFARYLDWHLARNPRMIQDLSGNLDQPEYRDILDVILEFLLVKVLNLAFSSIIILVYAVAIVSSSFEAYTAKVLSPKDMLFKLRTSWTKPIVTSFYMFLFTLGIISISYISLFISSISAKDSWSCLFFAFIPLLIIVWYHYVGAVWMLSVVVSVLEGFVGFQAIGRAVELMSGKRRQASIMMLPFTMFYFVVNQMDEVVSSYDLERSTRLAITISLKNGLNISLAIFMLVVFTVFYHERKTSHEVEKEVKEGLYLPIAAGEA